MAWGRKAALSIRFDDSHPSRLFRAIPILRDFGVRGTFMVCPGVPDFMEHLTKWKAVATRGDQEFANHTLDHRGASRDEAMAMEIGQAARTISEICCGKRRLLAVNSGGGTTWGTPEPLRWYLDTYNVFDASAGSLGLDDGYGSRVAASVNTWSGTSRGVCAAGSISIASVRGRHLSKPLCGMSSPLPKHMKRNYGLRGWRRSTSTRGSLKQAKSVYLRQGADAHV